MGWPYPLPIRLEVEFAVGLGESIEEVRALDGLRTVDLADLGHLGQGRQAAPLQGVLQ